MFTVYVFLLDSEGESAEIWKKLANDNQLGFEILQGWASVETIQATSGILVVDQAWDPPNLASVCPLKKPDRR